MSERDTAAAYAAARPMPLEGTSQSVLRQYYELTKPGISQMVALSTLAGYYLAIPSDAVSYIASASNWMHFGATMIGTLAISSGSCVVNHIMERDADARMRRTAQRPIPSGAITIGAASMFAGVLTLGGALLLSTVNMLTFWLAILTWVTYVAVYTPMKSRSTLAVLVGGIPGALPFAGGWTAVRGTFDPIAWVLFGILFLWQLPHFYALSWMYRADYREGGFALRAVRDNNGKTLAMQTIATSVLTAVACIIPTLMGYTGLLYAVGVSILGGWLVFESIRFWQQPETGPARRVLLTSYAVLMGVVVLIFLDKQ